MLYKAEIGMLYHMNSTFQKTAFKISVDVPLMMHQYSIAFNVALFDVTLFNVALFNVTLFHAALCYYNIS